MPAAVEKCNPVDRDGIGNISESVAMEIVKSGWPTYEIYNTEVPRNFCIKVTAIKFSLSITRGHMILMLPITTGISNS